MPILYSIDIDFDIIIPDFASIVNINGTSNKVWNKADKEGANNNGWDGAGNNNKDDNNKKDNNNREDDDNGKDIGGVKIQEGW